MKKLSTEITTKKGEIKIITVEVDDMYADWLVMGVSYGRMFSENDN